MTKVSQFYGFGAENHSASNNLMVPKKTIDFDKSFPINLDGNSPDSAGVDELVQNYRSVAANIKFSEKSYLAPILKTIKSNINKRGQIYSIILILIAGPILDIDDAKELIVELSHYPCQIVVVGVADTKYEQFEDLNEKGFKDYNNNKCCRSMTTFIQLKSTMDGRDITTKILQDLPRQLCEHLERISFKPSGNNMMSSMVESFI